MGQRGVMVGFTTIGRMISVLLKSAFSKFPLVQFTAEASTKGFLWTNKPSRQLLLAVVVTQLIATINSAEEILMASIGWVNAWLIWAYCLVWFFIEDLMKVTVYKLL